MKGRMLLVAGILVVVAATGCEDRRKKAIEKIDHDQEIVRRAGAAVNEVITTATRIYRSKREKDPSCGWADWLTTKATAPNTNIKKACAPYINLS